jgi:hypothetical protein
MRAHAAAAPPQQQNSARSAANTEAVGRGGAAAPIFWRWLLAGCGVEEGARAARALRAPLRVQTRRTLRQGLRRRAGAPAHPCQLKKLTYMPYVDCWCGKTGERRDHARALGERSSAQIGSKNCLCDPISICQAREQPT